MQHLRQGSVALLKALRPDLFTMLIALTVVAASVLPVSGQSAASLSQATNVAVGILFFLHGARLSRQAILGGMGHWRFHLSALALTFTLFPLLGIALRSVIGGWLPDSLVVGLVYLCVLPSTVQSSIAYTAMARGNVPAAICSASLSNLAGVFVTPLLVSLLIGVQSAATTLASMQAIVSQILIPFVAGHLLRPWIGRVVDRYKAGLAWFDRGVILAIVYRAFSAAIAQNLWGQLSLSDFALLILIVIALLAIAVCAVLSAGKMLKFDHADTVALMFCGTQKSLASGAPMASILFPAAAVGPILLPLMLYHQIQLMLGALLARHFLNTVVSEGHSPQRSDETGTNS